MRVRGYDGQRPKPSTRVVRFHGQVRNIKSETAANTVIPAKAGIQYAR